jgi:hypothetical protein
MDSRELTLDPLQRFCSQLSRLNRLIRHVPPSKKPIEVTLNLPGEVLNFACESLHASLLVIVPYIAWRDSNKNVEDFL